MNDFFFTKQFDLFHHAYLECIDFTEEVTTLTPRDEFHTLDDCMNFMSQAWHLIKDLDLSQCGHDFWLTRNRHGSGFWDRDYPKSLADELTRIAHEFREHYIEKEEENEQV